jgi:Tol biopolymer transport system component
MLSGMNGVRGRIRVTLAAAAFALLATVGAAPAAVPSGPRLAVVKVTRSPERTRIVTVDPRGQSPMRLAGGHQRGPLSLSGWGPLSWRPDGAEVAITGGGDFFLAGAGGGLRRINVASAERPVYAPDGHTIAFTRYDWADEEATTIWTIDLTTWQQRRLTPARSGLSYVATSFSPDGTTLLASRVDENRSGRPEPVALDLATGRVTRLLPDGLQPVYSPDGSKVALFRQVGSRELNDLFVLDVAEGKTRRLTRTQPGYELWASWDPSGERIAFARFRGRRFESANSIHQINADGTCETEILSQRRTLFYGPAWQPGPGREAGRIEC